MTLEPRPDNPLGWLILILIGVFLYAGARPSQQTVTIPDPDPRGQAVAPPGRDGRRGPMVVVPGVPENAEFMGVARFSVVVRESFPPQVVLEVSGNWPNGCSVEPQVVTQRDGSVVTVHIFRILPPDLMCTMVITPASLTVDISDVFMEDGTFRSGEYTINVNGAVSTASF
jgi:hypothetical protein